jgi:hypothetical protein
MLFAPWVINAWWGMDNAVPLPDANALVSVTHDQIGAAGKPLTPEDWVDAKTETIRQDDVLVRVESVRVGSIQGRSGSFLLVYLKLSKCKPERTVEVHPFDGDSQPKLTDSGGRQVPFLEWRRRKPRPARLGPPLYELADGQTVELMGLTPQEYLLVFAAPPTPNAGLKLEVPTSAWGRTGFCNFRISQLY